MRSQPDPFPRIARELASPHRIVAALAICLAMVAALRAQQGSSVEGFEGAPPAPADMVLAAADTDPAVSTESNPSESVSTAAAADPAESARGAAEDLAAKKRLIEAYQATMNSKLNHYLDWLARDDYDSASRLTRELTALVSMAGTLGDSDEWDLAIGRVQLAVDALDYGGPVYLNTVKARIAALGNVTEFGAPQAPPRTPRSLTSVMYSLDGILSDARELSDEFNFDASRRHARVLADLGRQLATARPQETYWVPRAQGLIDAATATADSTTTDQREFRQLLRTLQISCNECHEESS